MNKYLILAIIVLGIFIGGVMWSNSLSSNDPNIISTNGIHWHPQIEIYIKGEKQEIPKNIGIAGIHNPIHTHEDLPFIHLEFGGRVSKEDVMLGKFFEAWGKEFNSECIFEFCNGPDGKVRMFVNGKENFDFDRYIMQDKDKIVIRYE